MTDIKKPTGEELWWKYCTRGATTIQRDLADCFDAGIQHAREEMAQKRGTRPKCRYSGTVDHRACEACDDFDRGVAWADSGAPEPAPASEELVERLRATIEAGRVHMWENARIARAILAEIANGEDLVLADNKRLTEELTDARATISTLEARVKELEGDQLSAGREVERLMREYYNARKLHQAEVERLDRELGDAQFVAREIQSELEARDEELNSAREKLRALVDALKFEESL